MTAEDWVEDTLLNDASITTIIEDRIYALFTQTSERPYIIYRRNQTDSLKNLGTGEVIFEDAEIRLDLYADSYGEMVDLSNAVMETLDGAPGEFQNRTDGQGSGMGGLENFTAIPANQDLIYHTVLFFRVRFFV